MQNDAGTSIAIACGQMVNFFMVGSDMVRWEINCIGGEVCRLTVTHPKGTIVEYFRDAAQALDREKEIEGLFLSSRSSQEGWRCHG